MEPSPVRDGTTPPMRLRQRTMKIVRSQVAAVTVTVTSFCLIFAAPFPAQTASPQKETLMPTHATGPFEVKVTPQDDKSEDPLLGRMALYKQYHLTYAQILS